jgi:DNA (cytosine-5)-methyltransferase 1
VTAYYNEHDAYAAAWLRNLIAAGHIAPGVVDERSIEDVRATDLVAYDQCHFFAGVGVWSLALRRAGWADDEPVWTGSCPCQPFSAAGAGAGFDDERHLWPAFFHLIEQCRPAVVLGEQVASRDADPWIDLVQDDLEGLGYAVGAVPFPSAGVGAPHIRDRLYWVGHAGGEGRPEQRRGRVESPRLAQAGSARVMAHSAHGGRREERADAGGRAVGDRAQGLAAGSVHGGSARDLAHSSSVGRQRGAHTGRPFSEDQGERSEGVRDAESRGPVGGFWVDAEWIWCRDEKLRPVEPGTFPLAHGAAARVGRLRAYGNALNAEAARVFIEAVMEGS